MNLFSARKTLSSLALCTYALVGIPVVSLADIDEVVYFQTDTLGSAVAALNANGDLCWRQHYTPYGSQTSTDDRNPVTGCGLLGNERGYTGHTQDKSGLVYMQQRYFDPGIGRFLSVDPVQVTPTRPETFNRYAYALNNPYRFKDPNGESAKLVISFIKVGRKSIAQGRFEVSDVIDEGIGLVEDAATLLDGKFDWNDIAAISDIALGTEFNSKKVEFGTALKKGTNGKVTYIGKLDDIDHLPTHQTLSGELPYSKGAQKNWKENASVLRRKVREGDEIRDFSDFRNRSDRDATTLRPDRTVGQSALGAERNLLENLNTSGK